jgi:tetratricopeptide (TPR) repeat protein
MEKLNYNPIYVFEDHHEALNLWRKAKIKNLPLIHIDAHIDFAFQSVKDASLVIKEAKSIKELKSQLEKSILFRRKQLELERLTNIGNYIYPALRDSIVSEFYWVIPGDSAEFRSSLKYLLRTIKMLGLKDPKPKEKIVRGAGFIKTSLYGKNFYVFCLDTLPKIRKNCLLDIDTDFLTIPSIRKSNNIDEIGTRKPWITPEKLAVTLKNKIVHPTMTTIAYSVNGGYTPMIYRYLADLLAIRLGSSNPNLIKSIQASENFSMFRACIDNSNLPRAKLYYKKAVKLNPVYASADNNYGNLFAQVKRYPQAIKEFQLILKVDPTHSPSLTGMGNIMLMKKLYAYAENYFLKALKRSPADKQALLGLAHCKFHLNDLKPAVNLYRKYSKLESMDGNVKFALGKISETSGKPKKALRYYEEAMQLGIVNPLILNKLIGLADRLKIKRFNYLKNRLVEYRKNLKRANLLKAHGRGDNNSR